ncbi:MAG: acidic tetraheme cytochrome c3 TmcA [Desulfobacterales bacterium]|jgi:hypothetical protein
MAKKKHAIILCGALALVLACFCAYAQEDMEFVDDTAFMETMRPSAAFRHDEHNDIAGIDDCGVCHHLYDEDGTLLEGETSEDMECGECHAAGDDYPMDLVRAFHLNCRGCHEEQKAGPVVCGECHRRQR